MENRCIYCGVSADLSKSDIIPDALTNRKIINKNVCRIKHNNNFSDLFESKIIKELAVITNELDIKSSKSKSGAYHLYDVKIIIDGEGYVTRLRTDNNILGSNVMLKSEDGKKNISTIEKLDKIANGKPVENLDLNKIIITKEVEFNPQAFASQEMFRLIAKIAFEWYCLKNKITDKIDDFEEIINFG